MKKEQRLIDKDVKKMLLICLLSTLALIAGVPMIVFGATKSLWILLVLGIVCTVFGFYGMPILWVNFGSLKTLKRVVDAVMEEHLTTIAEIASQLQMQEREARDYVRKAINKKYITGYIYDGNTLVPNEKQAPKKKVRQTRCSNCGGVMEKAENGWICPYCGSKFENV